VKSFRTAGRRRGYGPSDVQPTNRRLRRSLWLLTVVVTAALFALLPAAAVGANPSANLDQCANGPAPSPSSDGCDGTPNTDWVNGNLGASKAVYFEGDSIPYRLTFDNLSLASHTVIIEWDTTKGGKHALDYIDSYNQSVKDANPCLGVLGCNFAAGSTFAIPADPQVTGAGVTPIAGNLTMFGGNITSVSAYSYPDGAGFVGDKSARIAVTFSASVANPVLAWGGHIASRADWGNDNSAVAIPGSPYHTRLIDLDGAGGNQDRSLSEDAVIFPGFIHIVKNATGGDATFGYTASPSPLANFNITTVGGTGEKDFNNITTFQTYTVSENAPPLHWAFDSLHCAVQSANGGSQTVNNMAATIALKEGEEVTCTYANHHAVNSPSLSTNAHGNVTLGANGSDLSDTATLAGADTDASGTITYHLYFGADCSAANEVSGSPVTNANVDGNGDYDSPSIHISKAGTYRWIANYGGDSNNSATSNGCNGSNENVVVSPRDTSLTTDAAGPYRIGEGGTVDLTDTATLSGGTNDATGTITFKLYGPDSTPDSTEGDCAPENLVDSVSVSVTNGADGKAYPSSPAISVTDPGIYHWVASYDGDNNNKGSESSCGAENENPLVIQPHISVVKTPDEQVIRNGDSVTWTIQVINDGSSPLTDVSVTDAEAPGCARTSADIQALASMAPGDTVTYECTRDSNTASFTNVAVATGTPELGEKVSAEDSAHVTVINPAISVSKTPHSQTVAFAGTVTFTIGVKNSGDATLTDVHVTDAQAPGCARTKADLPQLASMAPGDELSYSCTVASVTANFTNVAVAIGTPPVGPDVSASDSAAVTVGPPPPPVTHPAISIVKNPKSQTVTKGGEAIFTITVTNTGDVALTNVAVSDPRSPDCNRTIGTLAAGASVTYTCVRANVQASFDNVAVATGQAGSRTVTAQDTAPVTAKAAFVPKKVKPKVVSHRKPKATG
jgi:uncharacterized repeat protein (TIGR01451 family)